MAFPLVPQPKPERAVRKAATRRQARTFRLTRAQVRTIVFDRAKGHCERCGRAVSFDVHPYKDDHAEVHEDPPRSLGGDPLDPAGCLLTCKICHMKAHKLRVGRTK